LSKWDFDRLTSLLEHIAERALWLRDSHQGVDCEAFDLGTAMRNLSDIERDEKAIKALLKRERARRA
jgi:hypothetical protein